MTNLSRTRVAHDMVCGDGAARQLATVAGRVPAGHTGSLTIAVNT